MLFRIIRKVKLGTLTIKVTFLPSDEMPCEIKEDHAIEVVDAIMREYEDTEKPIAVVAFEIVDRYRRVERVDVSNGYQTVSCSCEDCFE